MMLALLFTATAEANKNGGKGGEKVDKEKLEREKKRDEEKKAVNLLLEKKDKDDNDQITLDEWLDGEKNVEEATSKFATANKNRDRQLSRSEIGAMLGF